MHSTNSINKTRNPGNDDDDANNADDDDNDDNNDNGDNHKNGGGFQVLNRHGAQPSRPSMTSGPGGFARASSMDHHRDSQQFNPVNTLAALYAQEPVPDAIPTFGPDNPHPSTLAALNIVTRWRRIHHIYSHLIFLGLQLVVLAALYTYLSSLAYFGIYLGFILAFYLAWVVAAWFGYPRRSLLANLLHMIGGRGQPPNRTNNQQYPYDISTADPLNTGMLGPDADKYRASYGRTSNVGSGRPRLSVDPITAAMGFGSLASPLDEQDEDDGHRQERMEQEMAGRDVVIMTIPKRRLTVVNA
jgi:hypothetical protein